MFSKTVSFLACSYFFICAIPHTIAARYILLSAIVLIGIIGCFQHKFERVSNSPIILSMVLFTVVSFFSALVSPYLTDSLQGFRKEYLPQLLIVIISSSIKQSVEEKVRFAQFVLWSILAGFAAKTTLAFWDGAINNPQIFSPYSNSEYFSLHDGLPRYVSYYAVEASTYVVIAYATLIFLTKSWSSRIVLALICSLSAYILLASGIRSAFAAGTLGLVVVSFIRIHHSKRALGFLLLITVLIGGTLVIGNKNEDLTRLGEIVDPQKYSATEGISGRYPIWAGMFDLIKERPLLGFGPGWQKLPEVVVDTGLLKQWENTPSETNLLKAKYFSLEYGQANPHNLALQVTFETGCIGFIVYMAMLFNTIWTALRSARYDPSDIINVWLKATVLGFFAAYFVINITNALLLHNTLTALMLITILLDQRQQSNR